MKTWAIGGVIAGFVALGASAPAMATNPTPAASPTVAASTPFTGTVRAACGPARPGHARCFAQVLDNPRRIAATPAGAYPTTANPPAGLSPGTLDAVYGFSPALDAGAGATIAVVDAFDDVNAAADLNGFSAEFGLPECNTTNPCFTKVNETGGSTFPSPDLSSGWTLEERLDIEWVHAIAPGANIVLVEATTDNYSDLFAADDYAATISNYVSNSWGSTEFAGQQSDDSTFTTPSGADFFFAAGDQGGVVNYPASAPNVIAVGGTSLKFLNGVLNTETTWPRGGGGCSKYETADPAQAAVSSAAGCNGARATPDLSLDADPSSGVAVYNGGAKTWSVIGGTSLSTPLMTAAAAVYDSPIDASTLYGGTTLPIRDITTGTNGFAAGPGYDLATGLGSFSYSPGAPTITSVTASGGFVTIDWTPPTGIAPTSYDIFTGSTNTSGNLLASGVTGTTYVANVPAGGHTGYYRVRGDVAAGDGVFSPVVSVTPTKLTASFTKSCSGVTCTFTSTSTDGNGVINSYKWSGGNGLSATTPAVTHTYSRVGQYSVQLRVTDSLGSSSTLQVVLNCKGTSTITCS